MQEWKEYIQQLQEEVASKSECSKEQLAQILQDTILSQGKQHQPLGVLFSGGVDSTSICYLLQQHNIPFIAITIGFQDNTEQKLPDDILIARRVAKEYNFTYKEKVFNFEEIEHLFKQTVAILGPELTNAVNIGVGSVELAAITLAKEEGIHYLMGGLGSEEIFAGYQRHKQAEDITQECWNGLENMYERDLLRDQALAKATDCTWLTPFLDKELIIQAMTIPSEKKISQGFTKYILREIIHEKGLKEEYAFRPKKAAQYGSRTDRALDKLAKKNGFQYKRDYLQALVKKVQE